MSQPATLTSSEGDAVWLELPGLDPLDGVVDYVRPNFAGIRTADGLYRVLRQERPGQPVGLARHVYADGNAREQAMQAWSAWLNGVFGQ